MDRLDIPAIGWSEEQYVLALKCLRARPEDHSVQSVSVPSDCESFFVVHVQFVHDSRDGARIHDPAWAPAALRSVMREGQGHLATHAAVHVTARATALRTGRARARPRLEACLSCSHGWHMRMRTCSVYAVNHSKVGVIHVSAKITFQQKYDFSNFSCI
eukprot:3375684-Prymnesium_polylepis.1